jgi:hypothetical protein
MINENLSIILKYAGSILAGFYGIYATLTNFRADKDGKKVLTIKGYVGIAILFLSTMLSLSTNAVKDIQDRNAKIAAARAEELKAEEARRKEHQVNESLKAQLALSTDTSKKLTEQLGMSKEISEDLTQAATSIDENARSTRSVLSDTDRMLHPIKDVAFYFSLKAPFNSPGLVSYRRRLNDGLKQLRPELGVGRKVDSVIVAAADAQNNPTAVRITPGSSLLPHSSAERLPYLVLAHAVLEIDFYLTRIRPEEYAGITSAVPVPPDLHMTIAALDEKDSETYQELGYQPNDNILFMEFNNVPSSPRSWRSSGRIVGVPDLLGSQVFVRLGQGDWTGEPALNLMLGEIRKTFELNFLDLSMSDGRRFFFQSSGKKYFDDVGFPYYVGSVAEVRRR